MEKHIREELQKAFTNGMNQGAKGIAGAVLMMAEEADGDCAHKLNKITAFCRKSLSLPNITEPGKEHA